ncbi:acyclic terpene utilization AtuA family protein [Carboxydothermus ferrireducens]|uniref:Acyclic terpene utilisation N-terminal domain-containing protein n=1 Tax=Carboxydothermus ferrireducens DSM 11255 TaxID=1119529 RepID=A0ABX2R5L4_9THEO|nr:acyclic terpene utilization AtuA family protein [Carboxydothermus ferrireducens]NYE56462.1 hypothetical protein [Carboxydothermus ferrireducens DSM 11255]
MEKVKILSPTAILGYGFPVKSFEAGLEKKPDVIAVDAGSVDPGPYYLGAGKSFTQRAAVKRDLYYMLKACVELNVPLLIGTAGGAGGRVHLMEVVEIIKELAFENDLSFKMAVIDTEIDKEWLKDKVRQRKTKPLGNLPDLTIEEIEEAVRIVAQAGMEPFIKALKAGAQVIVAGRAFDPAVFAAYPVAHGFDVGLSLHLGKILECAAIATEPGSGSDCLMGELDREGFVVYPLNPERRATPLSVSAHSLYEKTSPFELHGPGGKLDLSQVNFQAVDDRTVRVTGTKFIKTPNYYLKIEGVKKVGFRAISIAGSRDPKFIENFQSIASGVKKRVEDNFPELAGKYYLNFIAYGINGVMGALEPENKLSHEIGIVMDVVAEDKNTAEQILSFTRSTMLHFGFPGRISTAGNLAFPFSPSDIPVGDVYNFSIHHLVEVEDPEKLFPIEHIEIGGRGGGKTY